jgi:two-component system NtrC family sensor kinase
VAEVRERIDRKIQEQLRPKDLFYQLLHGLRSLVHYDHSAAVLIADSGSEVLDLVAEQLWWKRGKSERVGTKLALADATREFLQRRTVIGFDRIGEQWRAWDGRERPGLVEALDHGREGKPDERRECCLLLAPLDTEGGQLGVLKVASCQPGALGAYEAQLLRGFLPQAAVAIRNLARATSLETGIIEAEKKHAVADLARGVSHDVNNAFGSVLPLVQQMRTDLRDGRYDAATFDEDLAQIEASLQTCRRIFGGMLAFARPSGRADSGNVRRAIENVAAILQESLRGAGVRLETELDEPVPLLRTTQGDLEQLILNLATNARDAMPRGGTLHVRVRRIEPMQVALEIRDTGMGIAPEVLGRIAEPFFTTKAGGTGLGLSICRSIVDRMRGHIAFESQPGEGTRVRMLLPTADAPIPGELRVPAREAQPAVDPEAGP